jgi:hypothetical protein
MAVTEPSEFSLFRVCFRSVRFNVHGSAKFSEYVQTVSPDFEDSLAPDCVLTKFKIACAVSLIPGQHDCWNASSRYAPIAIAQSAAQSAEAIFRIVDHKMPRPRGEQLLISHEVLQTQKQTSCHPPHNRRQPPGRTAKNTGHGKLGSLGWCIASLGGMNIPFLKKGKATNRPPRKDMSRRCFVRTTVTATAGTLAGVGAKLASSRPVFQTTLSPEAALNELIEGNRRYMTGSMTAHEHDLQVLQAKTA